MTDFLSNIKPETSQDDMKQLSKYCSDLTALRERIAKGENLLKQLKAEEYTLSGETIPEFLFTKGISSLSLADGSKVEVREDIKISLPKTNQDKKNIVLDFIKNNGGKDIIKDDLTISSPEDKLRDYLINNEIPFKQDETVHAQTLKAFFNDLLGLKKGSIQKVNVEDVPKEANLYVYKKTIIK